MPLKDHFFPTIKRTVQKTKFLLGALSGLIITVNGHRLRGYTNKTHLPGIYLDTVPETER